MEDWDEGDHKRYQLTQRYLTAAERKVERNRRLIWQYRREVRADAREKRAALLFAARYEVNDAPKPEPTPQTQKLSNTPIPEGAYVSVKDGKTVTFLSPPNDTVLRARGLRAPETLVKREIHFHCDEIPAEYALCIPAAGKV